MKVYQTDEIRNIALVGSSKSGKTTLTEAMLFEGGQINRRGAVDDKNTVSDYRDIEHEKGNSVVSSVLHVEYKGHKINIIDAPGFADYVGEVVSAIHATDVALMVINAQSGVEAGTESAWRQIEKKKHPIMFLVNHLDHEKSNYEEALNQLKKLSGDKLAVVQYPVNAGLEFDSIIDLLEMKMYKYDKDGGKSQVSDIPADLMPQAESMKAELIESAAAGDEALMEKYFEEDTLNNDDIMTGLKLGMASASIFPVLCINAKYNMAVSNVMDFIIGTVPRPFNAIGWMTEDGKVLKSKVEEPFSALVFKTSVEPHLGEVSYFRVFAGQITEGMDVINASNGNKERITQLLLMSGKNREKVEKLVAGDIGATIKLKSTHTNDTLNDPKNSEQVIKKIEFPAPVYKIAIKAVNSHDDEKLGAVLNEMHRTDPTFLFGFSRELRQQIAQGQGELHINTMKWFLDNQHKIEIELSSPRVPYRETITKPAKAMYRHKKQTGGAGQFGEVHLMVQPYSENMPKPTDFPVRGTEVHELPWGGKLVFNSCIVGGAIDGRFMPAILKGIMERMEMGPLTGSYARDISVYVYDGKMHPVDSNEISFKLAGRFSFIDAFKNAGPKIMEPIYNLEVTMPDEYMGDVMKDLQGRRGMIMGMDSEGDYQKIRARVPLGEMDRYHTSLSAISSGRAFFTMEYAEYQQVPSDIQDKLLKEYQDSLEDED